MKDLCLENYTEISRLVSDENVRQLMKWGAQDRSPFEWLAYLTEEVGEHHYRSGAASDVVDEAIQVVTLAAKIAEMYRDLLIAGQRGAQA